MSKDLHRIYLMDLKNRIYKILPLCEEKNPNVMKHIESTLLEVRGLFAIIPSAKTSVWNIRVTSVLTSLSQNNSIEYLHSEKGVLTVKREVFGLLRLIDREIDKL